MSKTTKEFQLAYQKLNQEQRRAVDAIEGPVMLVAGPGTGKTQTLSLRIASILQKTDTPASSILALTYTESGARAMRTRLSSFIGSEAYYAQIATFHAFCSEVIRDNPDVFQRDPSVEPLSELEKLKIIYKLLDSTPLKLLRPSGAPYYYAVDILGAISDLKREGVSEDELEALLNEEELFLQSDEVEELKKAELQKRQKNLAKNRELTKLYRQYQVELKDTKSFDFEDMIASVVEAFKKNDDLLLSYQEKYLYILVDEYQDTNSAQNELLLLMTKYWGDKANVFVTGDPDQSIMRFQGASIENQLSFIKVYPGAEVITLKQNYRSTQTILDASDTLINHNHLRINDVVSGIDPHLVSQSGRGIALNLAKLTSSTAETIFIAEDIKRKIKSGVAPSDIAVIYHTNKESTVIADTLVKYGLDYSVQGGADVLSDPTVRNFLKILRVIHAMRQSQEDEDLFTILNYDIFQIDPLDVLKVARAAGDRRQSLFEVLANPDVLSELALHTRDKVEAAFESLKAWQAIDANHTFTEFFEAVLNESGYLTWVLDEGTRYKSQKRGAHHRLAKLNTFFDEVKRMNRAAHNLDLKGFIANLQIMEDNNIRLEESSYGVSRNAVTLTTGHKSKGLEWEHVYIYSAVDKNWGNNSRRDKITLPEGVLKNVKLSDKEKNEDERRLFYVALTRAKSNLTITYADAYNTYGASKQTVPSMFLTELGDEHVKPLDTQWVEEEAHKHIESLLVTQPREDSTDAETAFLKDLADNFKLAATSLNSYLLCAYKFKLDKLLKVPHAKKAHLSFGTAVHKALESFYTKLKNDHEVPSKEYLIKQFEVAMAESIMTKQDLKVYTGKGQEMLSSYYDQNASDFREPLATEQSLSVKLGDIELTGKIDRLEWVNDPELAEWADQAAKLVRVIDYKTGTPKTMGQIEGNTKDSDGELRRQLEFYKVLVDSDPTLNYQFGEGMLDFIEEPLSKGKDGKRRLLVKDEDADKLKTKIKEVMKSIRALEFPKTTNYKTCEKCYFKDHCWPNGIPTT